MIDPGTWLVVIYFGGGKHGKVPKMSCYATVERLMDTDEFDLVIDKVIREKYNIINSYVVVNMVKISESYDSSHNK